MTTQLKANKSWGEITREMLTAGGTIHPDEPDKNGQAWFLGTRFGIDAPIDVPVYRHEIWVAIKEENQAAAMAPAIRLPDPIDT